MCLPALTIMADPVTPERAEVIASKYMGTEPVRLVRKLPRRLQATNTAADTAPIYIYSRGAGRGFVIVSGDDCLPEVLAVVEQGDWDESQLPPALTAWVEGYSELIEEAQAQKMPARVPRKATGTRTIQPLCQTHWNQDWPYNNRCPWRNDDPNSRCLTGCVATAAAQVVYYWHRDNPDRSGYDTPTYGYGSPVTVSVPKGTPLRWDLMQSSYGGNTPEEMQSAVADLMFITGASSWVVYGGSTAGQIGALVDTFNGQYNLSSTCWYKSGNSQTNWEKIIIEDLEAGCPIVYSGVKHDYAGHAVVLDGYNHTNNLFHFNFGWGGVGDGWFTVDDETGMNYFNEEQGMTFRIHPNKYNMSGKILNPHAGEQFLQRVDNTIRVQVTNQSTIPQKGIYLFCQTGTSKPSSIDKATRKDETTVIPLDGTAVTELEFKPTLATSVYTLYLTDSNGTVLDKVENISVKPTTPDLSLRAINVNGASSTQETVTVDGTEQTIEVATVYDLNAKVTARVANSAAGTLCQPTLSCQLETYDAETGFTKSTSKNNSNTKIASAAEADLAFEFSKLKEGTLYKAALVPVGTAEVSGSETQVVYFRVTPADLAVTASTDDECTLSGHWNDRVFASLATGPEVVRYDLTTVAGDICNPAAANPNALYYVNSSTRTTGCNIVQDGVCDELILEPGYRFAPKTAFKARNASVSGKACIATWNLVQIPFVAEPPAGTFTRLVNGYNAMNAVNKADSVTSPMVSGAEHLLMSSYDDVTLRAKDATVGADELTVTFTSDVKVSTTYTTKDTQNKKLAKAIAEADELLATPLDLTSTAALNDLTRTTAEAKTLFTKQPYREDIKTMQARLSDAIDRLKAAAVEFTDKGWADVTGLIQNPSFESGTTKWTVKKPSGISSSVQNITRSQANYMANADGDKVIYMTYKANADRAYFFQTLTDVPDGTYRLEADLAADRGCHLCLFAGADSVTVESTDFGPFYFKTVEISDIKVTGGTLVIGAQTVDGWLKADNFRLYQTDGILTGVNEIEDGKWTMNDDIYDLNGRRVAKVSNPVVPNTLKKGVYIVNGKKVRR